MNNEIFYRERDDQLIILQENPCGCHHNEYLVFYNEKKVYICSFDSKEWIFKIMADRGYVKIGEFL